MLGVFEPARRRIADLLRSRRGGLWTVDEVAAAQGIHRTVAFEHLEALVSDGLAAKVSVKGGRGRPANAYRYAGRPIELSYPPQQTRLLGQVLARAASPSRAHETAREFGRKIGGLDRLEGDYEVGTESIHARTCIFDSVCSSSRDVVCGVHAGLIEGAMEANGRSVALTPEGPDGMGGCLFQLG